MDQHLLEYRCTTDHLFRIHSPEQTSTSMRAECSMALRPPPLIPTTIFLASITFLIKFWWHSDGLNFGCQGHNNAPFCTGLPVYIYTYTLSDPVGSEGPSDRAAECQ